MTPRNRTAQANSFGLKTISDEPREISLAFKINPAELKLLKEAAELAETNTSEFIRSLALKKAKLLVDRAGR